VTRLSPDAHRPDSAPEASCTSELEAARASWDAERDTLFELLAQQQRVAQAGMITAGLIHDVKNHLQSISGASYLALMSGKPDSWESALTDVQDQCRDLAETMNAFLAFVRRRGSAQWSRFRISEVLSEAARLVAPLADRARVEVEVDVTADAEVAGEPRLAIQMLVNLLSNAVRACEQTQGRIVLRSARPIASTCRIEVHDSGDGIPEEIRGRLFRPFATTHEGDGGTGLGLFIVRQTVRKLKGMLRMSTSPEGTTFTIDLPTS